MKPRARIIIPFWGPRYVRQAIDLALPSLLAPGNLPALAREFDCELVLVTETWAFEWIRKSPVYAPLGRHCKVTLKPIDDLIVGHWYGISLTKALCRGFADLGEAMRDTYLFFGIADVVFSDGCFAAVMARIRAGATVVNAPTYCAIEENVHDALMAARTDGGARLTMPPRALARLLLDNRHYTIRAKTVNQQAYRMHRQDQFYWHVDADTLIGRQMPVYLICIKPEVARDEIRCFWDYCVAEELAPSADYCVIGDTDEALLFELRTEKTYKEHLALGALPVEDIARDLGAVYPKNHFDMGRFDLTLHAGDLPDGIDDARARLGAYMDRLYSLLPARPVSYIDHPFWAQAIGKFESLRRQHLAGELVADAPAERTAPAPDINGGWQDGNRIYRHIFGRPPNVKRWHPYWGLLTAIDDAISESDGASQATALIVSDASGLIERGVQSRFKKSVRLTVPRRDSDVPGEEFCTHGAAEFCFIDLDFRDLAMARDVVRRVRPFLKPGAGVVIGAVWSGRDVLRSDDATELSDAFPFDGQTRTIYFGGRLLYWSLRAFSFAETVKWRMRPLGLVAATAMVAIGAACALAAGRPPKATFCGRFVAPGIGFLMQIESHDTGVPANPAGLSSNTVTSRGRRVE